MLKVAKVVQDILKFNSNCKSEALHNIIVILKVLIKLARSLTKIPKYTMVATFLVLNAFSCKVASD